MAGEAKKVYGSQFTLSSGSDGAISNGAVATPGGTNPYSSTQTGDYPNLDMVLTCGFGAAGTEGTFVDLHIVPQQIDGTTDAADITATYRPYFKARFQRLGQTGSASYFAVAKDVPKEGKVMLYNASGQQISANYTLKATPWTLGPA